VSGGEPSDIFTSRGIAADVRDARGYRRYAAKATAAVLKIEPRFYPHRGWLRQALTVPGWLMPKYAPMPEHPVFGAAPIAQLRPDAPVFPEWYGHDHDGMRHLAASDTSLADRAGVCFCGIKHNGVPRRRRGPRASEPAEYWAAKRWRAARLDAWEQRPLADRALHEAKVCEVEQVVHEGRPVTRVVPSGHIVDRAGEYLIDGHLRYCEAGEVVIPTKGPHRHVKRAKYLFSPGEGAKRLDTHPSVRAAGYAAPEGLFVWCIEGTLKLDSIVSAGWPGVETGSVTLWRIQGEDYEAEWNPEASVFEGGTLYYDELADFAERYLRGVPTAVVCDSDWYLNHRVREQTEAAAALLEENGVPAIACAPPEGEFLYRHPVTDWPVHAKQGIDDYLAGLPQRERHDSFLDLLVREHTPDEAPGLENAVARASLAGVRADAAATLRKLLCALGEIATSDGLVPYKRAWLSNRIGRAPRNVDNARDRAVELGLMRLITEPERIATDTGWRTKPGILLLERDLVRPRTATTLRDWLNQRLHG